MPDLNHLVVFGLIAAVLLSLFKGLKRRSGSARGRYNRLYVGRQAMTPTERRFFLRLREALPAVTVAPQVAMSALVDVSPRVKKGAAGVRAKVAQKRLDFVLFDSKTGEAISVIELDDRSHDSPVRKAADRERDAILAAAGLRVHRFDAREMPEVRQLRRRLS